MNPKLQGRMIRQKRLEKNWSQEGLSSGICAASYLSKIEQGTVEAGPDVVRPLLARLGIAWNEDPDFCREMGIYNHDY